MLEKSKSINPKILQLTHVEDRLLKEGINFIGFLKEVINSVGFFIIDFFTVKELKR